MGFVRRRITCVFGFPVSFFRLGALAFFLPVCNETLLKILCRVFAGIRHCSGTTHTRFLTQCFLFYYHASVAFVFSMVPPGFRLDCFIRKICGTRVHSYPECKTHPLPSSTIPPLIKSTACRRSWVARAVTPLVCRRLVFLL